VISYKPFLKLLIDRDLSKKKIMEDTGIGWSTLSKMNSNKYISLEVIDRLCEYLDCQPGDLIEYVKTPKKNKISKSKKLE
jgi:DNA-binding Xre family transcriptional regulator